MLEMRQKQNIFNSFNKADKLRPPKFRHKTKRLFPSNSAGGKKIYKKKSVRLVEKIRSYYSPLFYLENALSSLIKKKCYLGQFT